jgi:hypothetical protein
MLRVDPMERAAASWSSPVLRAAITEVIDDVQHFWRVSAPTHQPGLQSTLGSRLAKANQTSLLTPTTLAKFTLGGVALLVVLAHLQTALLIGITLALAYLFLRQFQQNRATASAGFLPIVAPILISLGALLGSANLGAAAPWLLVVLLVQVIFWVMRSQQRFAPEPTWIELLQILTEAPPLQQLVALETLRQQSRQGQLDPTQRQVLRQALHLLLNQEIPAEVRQAIVTALPQLAPRRSLLRLNASGGASMQKSVRGDLG